MKEQEHIDEQVKRFNEFTNYFIKVAVAGLTALVLALIIVG